MVIRIGAASAQSEPGGRRHRRAALPGERIGGPFEGERHRDGRELGGEQEHHRKRDAKLEVAPVGRPDVTATARA